MLPDFCHEHIGTSNPNKSVTLALFELHDLTCRYIYDIALIIRVAFVVRAAREECPAFSTACMHLPAKTLVRCNKQKLWAKLGIFYAELRLGKTESWKKRCDKPLGRLAVKPQIRTPWLCIVTIDSSIPVFNCNTLEFINKLQLIIRAAKIKCSKLFVYIHSSVIMTLLLFIRQTSSLSAMIERVKLLEYEAKNLLGASGIPIPKSYVAGKKAEFLPAVIKSQVPTGGRGEAGGVVVVENDDEYSDALKRLLVLEIEGHTPKTLLAEELLAIDRELYLSFLIDKDAAAITLMAHANGGVEVEENAADSYLRIVMGKNVDFDAVGQQLADYYGLPEQTFALQDLAEKLFHAFTENDALLLEINPLVLTTKGNLVAGDCKMECDDAAAFRHPDWHFEAEKSEVNFVTLNQMGNVATIANGAGLAMATVDAVADAGMTPANFLDVGGGASEASILAAFKRISEYPNVQAIIINIFAGITRCDEVAKAIVAAQSQLPNLPPLAIRLAGTNYEQAASLLANHGVTLQTSLAGAIGQAKQEVSA